PQDNPHFGLDKEKNKLFIDYGYKINVENYVKDIGGNACNAAVGISRLGKNVGLCAEIGSDEFSSLIINKLNIENINTSFVTQTPAKKTSFSICINYLGERTLFVEHVERLHNFNFENSSADFIYLTSLGNKWEDAYQKALDFVKKTHAKLAFNPGTLQIDTKNALVIQLIELTDYLFLNKEEAEKILYGKDKRVPTENSDIKKILFGLKNLGAKNIIVTDSYNGSFVFDSVQNYYHLGIINADVLEKTGAGDAYTAGFISAILNTKSITDAMVWGSVNAASVVQKIGAQEGLLKMQQMEEKLNYLGKFTPQVI
ncbi:MAG: hypothetical protein A2171_01740, partial [Candidatus Levybacteria bacterium RBG_13_35_9]